MADSSDWNSLTSAALFLPTHLLPACLKLRRGKRPNVFGLPEDFMVAVPQYAEPIHGEKMGFGRTLFSHFFQTNADSHEMKFSSTRSTNMRQRNCTLLWNRKMSPRH